MIWPPYDIPEPGAGEPCYQCTECGWDQPTPCPPSCPTMAEPEDTEPFDDYSDGDFPLAPIRRWP